MERTLEVHVKHRVEVRVLHRGHQSVPGDAGVVHQQLHAAQLRPDLRDRLLDRFPFGNVAAIARRPDAQSPAFLCYDACKGIVSGVDQGQVRPQRGKPACDGRADASGGSGDYGHFPFQHSAISFPRT